MNAHKINVNGALFKVTPIWSAKKKGYDWIIFLISIVDSNGKPVRVNAKPIRKYHTFKACTNFLEGFESKSEADQMKILADKITGKKESGNYKVLKAQYVQIFRELDNGKRVKLGTTIDRREIHEYLQRYDNIILKHGAGRWAKVPEKLVPFVKEAETKQDIEMHVKNRIVKVR